MAEFRKKLNKWKEENGVHGKYALPRFVMFQFLDRLTQTSDDFVFKGGNLLWFYIQTPRPTVDLDFVTSLEKDASKVMETLHQVCTIEESGIIFSITSHKVIEENEKIGLAIDVLYRVPEESIENKFSIDIVLGIQTDIKKIEINNKLMNVASLENIICDKLQACHSFGSGNTRAKDYDDLIRISQIADRINPQNLKRLSELRSIPLEINYSWISEVTENAWTRHLSKYTKTDLPANLEQAFDVISEFLTSIKS